MDFEYKNIPEIKRNYFKTTNEKLLKKRVTEFVKDKLVGKNFLLDNKKKVVLTWQGLKNDINEYHTNYIEKLISFVVFDKILNKAVFLYSEQDKRGRANIFIYKFFSQVKVGSIKYDVIIIVKKTSRTYIYDHILIKS